MANYIPRGGKRQTGNMLQLPIQLLKKTGTVTWRLHQQVIAEIGCQRFPNAVQLNYIKNGEPIEQHIPLQYTPCHYGGYREWLTCPNCKRRCAVLYGSPFYCRQCHNLAYTSTCNSESDRLFQRMDKIRRRLKVPTISDITPYSKPPRMRWRTFSRLYRQFEALEQQEYQLFKLL